MSKNFNTLVDNGKQYVVKVVNAGRGLETQLTKGKEYITIHGIQAGLVDTPYISVIADDNKPHTFYSWRFEIVKEVE